MTYARARGSTARQVLRGFVRQADTVTVFSGSANCSRRAALTAPGIGRQRRADDMPKAGYATMSSVEFEEGFLAELAEPQ